MELDGYSVRPLTEDDLEMVLRWRNLPRVHDRMFTKHDITWEEHYAWFKRQEKDNPREHLIFMAEGEPIGYIGYINRCALGGGRRSLGVYIGVLRDNPLDGVYLYVLAALYGFEVLGLAHIDCETLVDNPKALAVSRYVGFCDVREDTISVDNSTRKVQLLTMSHAEWQRIKQERF